MAYIHLGSPDFQFEINLIIQSQEHTRLLSQLQKKHGIRGLDMLTITTLLKYQMW